MAEGFRMSAGVVGPLRRMGYGEDALLVSPCCRAPTHPLQVVEPPSPREFQGNQIKWVSTSTAPARLISPNSGNFCSANMIYGSSSVKMNPHKPQTTLACCSGLWLRRVFPVRLDGAAHQQFGVTFQMSAQTSVCSTGR